MQEGREIKRLYFQKTKWENTAENEANTFGAITGWRDLPPIWSLQRKGEDGNYGIKYGLWSVLDLTEKTESLKKEKAKTKYLGEGRELDRQTAGLASGPRPLQPTLPSLAHSSHRQRPLLGPASAEGQPAPASASWRLRAKHTTEN